MTETMRKFLEEASQDGEFFEKLQNAETAEAVIALAAEKGYTLTAEDLEAKPATGELSDDELDDVAGGVGLLTPLSKLLMRFNFWTPAANGLFFTKESAPAAGNAMFFKKGDEQPAAGNTVYFGGIGGPTRLGGNDGGSTLTEV